jgi:hypothetical protein
MNGTKHTPGPWHHGKAMGDHFYVEHEEGDIASINYQKDVKEREANAKLISAAPDLLEALAWILDQVPNLKGDISLIGMQNCHKAIKKATR